MTMRRLKKWLRYRRDSLQWTFRKMRHFRRRYQPQLTQIPTYDGSGQTVHPCVLFFPESWKGYRYWMAFTPYPDGNDQFENPSLVVSGDGVRWFVPPGLHNPIVDTPGEAVDFLSDPHIMVHDDVMYLIYREQLRSVSPPEERWFMLTSRDGVLWGEKRELFRFENSIHVSACMLHDGKRFVLYYVTYGLRRFYAIERRTCAGDPTDGANWSDPQRVELEGLEKGVDPWHIEVFLQPEGTWDMLLTTCTGIGGVGGRLHYAASRDGLSWRTTEQPFIEPTHAFDSHWHYKATMVRVREGRYKLWYSAMSVRGTWHTLYLQVVKQGNSLVPVSR
ncbi:hypothetical protein [Paenibacillus cymbidii]|uniref:hypothetical protein n=1 Tax=Paenibacillus cymbidii TaxID=1639034 RepID=UPI001081B545|nr:hypothetical protein [Paenibacillus cymbidii]